MCRNIPIWVQIGQQLRSHCVKAYMHFCALRWLSMESPRGKSPGYHLCCHGYFRLPSLSWLLRLPWLTGGSTRGEYPASHASTWGIRRYDGIAYPSRRNRLGAYKCHWPHTNLSFVTGPIQLCHWTHTTLSLTPYNSVTGPIQLCHWTHTTVTGPIQLSLTP
jgi:hypothetical protein